MAKREVRLHMKKQWRYLAIIGVAMPLIGHATPFALTVSGRIYDSADTYGNLFGRGAGLYTVVGDTAQITFYYDTATAPQDSDPSANQGHYYRSSQWISSLAWVDSAVVPDFTNGSGDTNNVDGIELKKDVPNASYDALSAEDYAYYDQQINGEYRYATKKNYLSFNGSPFLSSDSLNQSFSLNAPALNNIYGYIYAERMTSGNCQTATPCVQGWAAFHIEQVKWAAQPVPEPITLTLLGAGLAGLGVVRRWSRHG